MWHPGDRRVPRSKPSEDLPLLVNQTMENVVSVHLSFVWCLDNDDHTCHQKGGGGRGSGAGLK